jgi:TolA-binding protein
MISFRSVLIAVVLAGALPSQAGLFSDDEARKSLYDLRAEFLQYKAADEARLTRLETNIDTLQQANNRIQQSLDRLDQAIRNLNLPALQTQLESVSSDVAKLNGSVEVQTNVIEQDQKRNKEFYLDLDSRLRALEKTGGAGAVFPAPNKSGQASDALKSPPGKKDEGVVTASEGDASASASSSETPPKTSNAAASSGPQAVSSAAEQKSYDQAYQAFKASNFLFLFSLLLLWPLFITI